MRFPPKTAASVPVALALATFGLLALAARSDVTLAGNESSRLAAVESLVERGTFAIDGSPFRTVDSVRVDGRTYSDKPPLLTVWLAAVYGLLRHGFGLSFADPGSYGLALRLLTAVGIGSFCVVLVLLFFWRLETTGLAPEPRAFLSATAVFGTWVLPYGVTISNHAPAATIAFATWIALERWSARPAPRRALGAGLLAGALLNLDLPTGGLFALGGLTLIRLGERGASVRSGGAFAIGVAVPAAILVALDLRQHGSVFPAYLVSGAYDDGFHAATIAGLRPTRDLAAYWRDVTLGSRGILSHLPVLLFAGAATWSGPPRRVLAAVLLAVALFYGTATGDYGGWAFGFRYLVPLVPLLFLFAIEGFLNIRARRRRRSRRAVTGVFVGALLIGIFTSAVGAWNPWPVCFEGEETNARARAGCAAARLDARVRSPLAANLLCLAYERSPDAAWTRQLASIALGTDVYEERLTRRYLERAFVNLRRPERLLTPGATSRRPRPDPSSISRSPATP